MQMLPRYLCILLVCSTPCLLFADNTIEAAQRKLKNLGLYNGVVDGQPGSQTSAAIRRYQVKNHLRITGELNSETNESLGLSKSTKSNDSPAKASDSADKKTAKLDNLFAGGPLASADAETQTRALKKAKEQLNILGYYRGPMDGDVSSEFLAALKNYQLQSGRKATARLDKATLRGLLIHDSSRDKSY